MKAGRKFGKGVVVLYRLFRRAADDEGGSGFVDEDIVDFVNDREIQFPLYPLGSLQGHVVAQVIEAELVVGAVGDVGAIGRAPGYGTQELERLLRSPGGRRGGFVHFGVEEIGGVVLETGYRHSQSMEDRSHPYRVTAG